MHLGFGLFVKTWRCMGGGPRFGWTLWRGRREFHNAGTFALNFWVGKRMFCVSRNCV
jgi:hypothetical protein